MKSLQEFRAIGTARMRKLVPTSGHDLVLPKSR